MTRLRRCAGFPQEGSCENQVDRKLSPLWCPECEKKRRAHLDKQFKKLAAVFGITEDKPCP